MRLARRAVRERVELMGFKAAMTTQTKVAKVKVGLMVVAGWRRLEAVTPWEGRNAMENQEMRLSIVTG